MHGRLVLNKGAKPYTTKDIMDKLINNGKLLKIEEVITW